MADVSVSITPDLKVKRAWNVSATAAATNSATTATKSAAVGSAFIMTGIQAGFMGTSTATALGVNVKVNGTNVRWYAVPIAGTLNVQLTEDTYVVGGENQAVAVVLDATATSASTGFVSIEGFHVGKR